jgi:hypothetical protein
MQMSLKNLQSSQAIGIDRPSRLTPARRRDFRAPLEDSCSEVFCLKLSGRS